MRISKAGGLVNRTTDFTILGPGQFRVVQYSFVAILSQKGHSFISESLLPAMASSTKLRACYGQMMDVIIPWKLFLE